MKSRFFAIIATLLFISFFASAQDKQVPIDEQAIQKEMAELIGRTGTVPQDQREDAAKLVTKGTRAHDEQKHDKALDFFQQALEKDPLSWLAWGEMGNTYLAMGNQNKALDAIVRATALNPRVGFVYILKGNILDYMGLDTQAIDAYRKAVVLEGNPWLAWLNMGITFMRRNDLDQAENALTNARNANPEQPSPHFHLAKLAQIRGWTYVEEDNLKRFTHFAKGDPRMEAAQKRLKELTTHNINLDPTAPFSSVDMIAQMSRALWRSEKHRETFPDAKAYFPSLEEEHEVWMGVLEIWREEKAKNKAAKHDTYDLVLRVADAGFLDEYLVVSKQKELGDRAKTWLDTHKDRVEAFQSWAEKEGIGEVVNPKPEQKAQEGALGLIEILTKTTVDSSLTYTMKPNPSEQELEAFFTGEATRFTASIELSGNDKIDCSHALEQGQALTEKGFGAPAFTSVFRCFSPTSPEWKKAANTLAGSGMTWRFSALPRLGVVVDKNDEIVVKAALSPGGFAYTLAKAAWRREESLRTRYGGDKVYRPSVLEEVYAWAAAAQGYLDLKKTAQEKGETFKDDPFMEGLLIVTSSGPGLRGFVLVEVLHKGYGVPLRSLSDNDAKAVADYIANDAFVIQAKQ